MIFPLSSKFDMRNRRDTDVEDKALAHNPPPIMLIQEDQKMNEASFKITIMIG
jgi:hypothetical protein